MDSVLGLRITRGIAPLTILNTNFHMISQKLAGCKKENAGAVAPAQNSAILVMILKTVIGVRSSPRKRLV